MLGAGPERGSGSKFQGSFSYEYMLHVHAADGDDFLNYWCGQLFPAELTKPSFSDKDCRIMPNGDEFEHEIARTLDEICPHSRLSRVLLFRPDLPEHRRYGFEIDHLLHVRDGLVDRLFIIECKAQRVSVVDSEWQVTYADGTKDAKAQLWNQAVSLLRHLAYSGDARQLRVEARRVVISGDKAPRELHQITRLLFICSANETFSNG